MRSESEFGVERSDARARLRVWLVTPTLHRAGGTERAVAEQVEQLASQFDLTVFTMASSQVDLRGVELVRVPYLRGPDLFRFVWWLFANAVARWAHAKREGKPDVVYSTGINTLRADAVSIHIIFSDQWRTQKESLRGQFRKPQRWPRMIHRAVRWRLLVGLERRIYRSNARVWTLSAQDARTVETLFGRPHGSVASAPYGVDTNTFSRPNRESHPAFKSRPSGRALVLALGNDVRTKGLDTVLRAVAELPDHVDLWVVTRSDHQDLLDLAERLGIGSRLTLWSPQPDVMAFYAAADVLVAPSRHDAFGLPALEAMACGVPVIASSASGVSELLTDGYDSFVLADPEDAPAIASRIRRLLGDASFADSLASHGEAVAMQHSWQRHAEVTAEQLQQATTPRR